tara:strand:+ start:1759 stop:2025 length:267 start_codon:yes stop_codon:yes gene_type:complete
MKKLKWSDESFEEKVKALIRDHLHPLASDCKGEEDLLALCVAHITAGVRLMHEVGYKQQEIEDRLLMTVDMVLLASGLSEREQSEILH